MLVSTVLVGSDEFFLNGFSWLLKIVPSWTSDEDFKDALRKAGLM
ncbi:hypothetical protein HanXRQr2_Chr11g0515641 [Helianthus annuus]|uniref:Uncharacterized protein n=1 Tax=Helianthus annuus TaxID=4232 RepID=A0A9K3N1Y5_HELAN|nr:hypothetical protein HanXRQr2_Chr11g0515641 [Helianthus annuus]KAJ0503330.1 hypothetical protein HanHA300_Chr11g0423071 [Helianthus annuus]KAJ0519294.1 hypothetical protein HanHA89_Chr11g0447171 [Helianthus annuus]KAJ0687291.1 hypothetical protein HanLR1_Chr11g0424441 [Helianthus annuus]KAJ0691085.1 hypothetical protein HanOQP8_Chr11g0425171 [Helianthus annuus]